MRLYHSAFTLKDEFIPMLLGHKIRILRSYYSSKDIRIPQYCSGIFLDSGAFSARNKKVIINLSEYIEFCKTNGDVYDAYANLDVIGNPQKTWHNQILMDKAGLNAIPTFHMGEPFSFLKKYLDQYDYIALGGLVRVKSNALRMWLDGCWEEIKKTSGMKVHGFGMTDINLIKRYPWYSIDSTTASRAGRIGVLLTPWGQLLLSESLKIKTSSSIKTPGKIKVVFDWVKDFVPGLVSDWSELASPSVEASNLRSVINVLYMESLIGNYS